jgi:hypothetical protein
MSFKREFLCLEPIANPSLEASDGYRYLSEALIGAQEITGTVRVACSAWASTLTAIHW